MSIATNKVYDNVVYKGEVGSLTLTQKFFHYQANIVDASVKCTWARVEKRQLSPPGAAQPMLKLILVSGKAAVFELADTRTLLDLVKEVKIRMEKSQEQALVVVPASSSSSSSQSSTQPLPPPIPPPTERSSQLLQLNYDDDDNNDEAATPAANKNNNNKPKTKRSSVKPHSDDGNGDNNNDDGDEEAPNKQKKRQSSSSQPPVLENQDPYLSNAHDKRDDSRATLCYCPWESIYCWICLATTVVLIIAIAIIIYFFAIKDKGGSHEPKSGCEDPTSPECPPDDGKEGWYGIRGVEYVWTPEEVRLEYYISDYIFDGSIHYTVFDGVQCRDSDDEIVPEENEWLYMELRDGAPQDGGANQYNEGRGTRQFDIILNPRRESNLVQAPFYITNTADISRAFLRVCVLFSINYNQIQGFQEEIEVNYIQNAIQMTIGNEDDDFGIIQDVQIKTVTRPQHKLL